MRINPVFGEGLLDGFSEIGLFTRLRRPGAPDELIDSRPMEEFLPSEDFTYMLRAGLRSPDKRSKKG